MKRDTNLNILAFESDKDKIMRAQLVSPTIESGRVYIQNKAAWLPDFITEISLFPNGKHDDQVDALTQALLNFKRYTKPAMIYGGGGIQSPIGGNTKRQNWM